MSLTVTPSTRDILNLTFALGPLAIINIALLIGLLVGKEFLRERTEAFWVELSHNLDAVIFPLLFIFLVIIGTRIAEALQTANGASL